MRENYISSDKLFKWNEDLQEKFGTARLLKVRINLKSAYEIGSGWQGHEREMYLFEEEISDIFNYLEENSKNQYKLCDPSFPGACKTIKAKFIGGDIAKADLYLHPTEFTGYLPKEDLDLIVSFITRECLSMKVLEVKTENLLDLTDNAYKKLMIDNIVGIRDYLDNFRKAARAGRLSRNDICGGPEAYFVHNYRPKYPGLKTGYSSSDIDWEFIETFDAINTRLKDYDRTHEVISRD